MIACFSLNTLDVLPARYFPTTSKKSFTSEDALTFLQNCANFKQMRQIHAKIIRNRLHQHQVIVAKLIRLCSSYRELDYATLVFQHIENPSTFVYNLLIRAYTVNDRSHRAIFLYNLMICRGVGVDKFTFPFVVKACLACSCVEKAKEVYGVSVKTGFYGDVYLDNVLMDLYMKCGVLDDALKVFDKMRFRTVVSWTTVISGLVFHDRMDLAHQLFDKMPIRNAVSWTAMINGYAKSKKPEKAFELFVQMQRDNAKLNEYTLVGLLMASAELGSLKLGSWIHDFAIKNGFEIGVFLGTALIDMYSKCGSLEYAKRVFEMMKNKNVPTWNAMITSLGVHGHGEEALRLFDEMEKTDVKPDEITFTGVLSACLQMSDIDKGRRYLTTWLNAMILTLASSTMFAFSKCIQVWPSCLNWSHQKLLLHDLLDHLYQNYVSSLIQRSELFALESSVFCFMTRHRADDSSLILAVGLSPYILCKSNHD